MKKCIYNPNLRNHTHCQVAQKSDTQTKTCQRVWLPRHTDRLRRIKHENLTINIGHLADSAKFEMSTINIIYSGLIGWSFEMPNAPYSSRCGAFYLALQKLI